MWIGNANKKLLLKVLMEIPSAQRWGVARRTDFPKLTVCLLAFGIFVFQKVTRYGCFWRHCFIISSDVYSRRFCSESQFCQTSTFLSLVLFLSSCQRMKQGILLHRVTWRSHSQTLHLVQSSPQINLPFTLTFSSKSESRFFVSARNISVMSHLIYNVHY